MSICLGQTKVRGCDIQVSTGFHFRSMYYLMKKGQIAIYSGWLWRRLFQKFFKQWYFKKVNWKKLGI